MSKNDMKDRICTLSKNDLKDLVKTYRIPLDLHPRLPDPGFTMDRLPADAIGIYSKFLWFFKVCVPFSTFILSVLEYFKDVCMDDGPSSLKKWKDNFFLIDHRAVLDYLTWRNSCSCVLDDLPSDGYDRNDMQRLHAYLIHLHEIREEVLVHSSMSSVWFNKEWDLVFRRIDNNVEMSIYDSMTLPYWSDAKIVKESHHLSLSLLERVSSHTTASASEGAMVPLPTPYEIPDVKNRKLKIIASKVDFNAPELGQAEGMDDADLTDFCANIKDSLEKDEGASTRAASAPIPCLGKRLGAPPYMAVVSASKPSHVGTSAHASISRRSLSLGGVAILKDDFGTATHGEEIDLTLFPLAFVPYHMPYSYEGVSSPLKALDRTITPIELRRTESLLPLELLNHVNVLSALLVSHGYDLNSRYTNMVSSSAHLQEKLDKKKGDVKLLRLEVTSLDNKLENLQRSCDALGQENRDLSKELTKTDAKLSEQALTVRDMQNELVLEKSKSQGYKDAMDGLREEVTQFISSGIESLVRKLLSSDEFHAALACVASLESFRGKGKTLCFHPSIGELTCFFLSPLLLLIISSGGSEPSDAFVFSWI
nr:hypothetical protein [Tanacetum cinerariifolium]